MLHAGYHARLPEDAQQARQQGAALNPRTQRSAAQPPEFTAADAQRPAAKDDEIMRQAAQQGDAGCRAGRSRKDPAHAYKRTGVQTPQAGPVRVQREQPLA